MPTKRRIPKSRSVEASSAVTDYLNALEHPQKAAVRALRKMILAIDPRIREEVKWNAPSFRIEEHFATFRLQPVPNCQLVLHTGSKVRKSSIRLKIPDPEGILKWASADRCIVAFASYADAKAKGESLKRILKAWIEQAGIA